MELCYTHWTLTEKTFKNYIAYFYQESYRFYFIFIDVLFSIHP